jgi:hypothetical protein
MGPEPDLRGDVSNAQIISAYNWYNYFYDSAQAKEWIIEYLKEFHKTEKDLIKNANRIDDSRCRTSGWNCRILLLGGDLPDSIKERNEERIRALAMAADTGSTGAEEEVSAKKEEVKQVISIQERVANRANDLIASIEEQIDAFYRDGTQFKVSDWLAQQNVKPAVAQRIADYYKPLYSELFDALSGKVPELREAYSSYTKPKLKAYVEFIKSIVSAAETRAVVVKTERKPRKKKIKPASVQVAKLKYKEKDETYSLQSVRATDIPGCSQLWVFNTKYRTLAVYNAMGPAGLGIKGCTVIGYDEKTSIVKKLRKPEIQLKKLLEGGKVVLRKFMDEIKCKSKEASGRINNETILLRIIK